jgi:hypothetical protein
MVVSVTDHNNVNQYFYNDDIDIDDNHINIDVDKYEHVDFDFNFNDNDVVDLTSAIVYTTIELAV